MTALMEQFADVQECFGFAEADIHHLAQGSRYDDAGCNHPRNDHAFFPALVVLLFHEQNETKAAARQFFDAGDARAERVRHRGCFYEGGRNLRLSERTHIAELPHLPAVVCQLRDIGGSIKLSYTGNSRKRDVELCGVPVGVS